MLLTSQVKASEKYIDGQLELGLSTREEACAVQVQHLSDLIRARPTIDQDECSQLFEHLTVDNGTFSSEDRKTIAKLAQARCNAIVAQGGSAAEDDHQTNLFLHRYYPDWLWSILLSDECMHN